MIRLHKVQTVPAWCVYHLAILDTLTRPGLLIRPEPLVRLGRPDRVRYGLLPGEQLC